MVIVMYPHTHVEKKWQKRWLKEKCFRAHDSSSKPKVMILDMFPYPSGAGLHVGHPEGYTASDILARTMVMKGYEVLHPMGWDAFGLPAENYAIKTGTHPKETTKKNIAIFKRQIQSFGFWIDWDREINTSDPSFYQWTQWLFLQLYKRQLAVRKKAPVNWCPSCQTVLANEQVIDGACERCGTSVIQKELKQWFFRITNYAEELLKDLDDLDWPENIKLLQRNWIGKSEGAELHFAVADSKNIIDVFTTRPDTLYGATYIVLSPEHPLVQKITPESHRIPVEQYVKKTAMKSALERTDLAKEKTGVFTGAYALNPANGEKIPIWVADYVLMDYGTGAIMAVPAHDERDFVFAKQYQLPVRPVVQTDEPFDEKKAVTGSGIMIDSGPFTGQSNEEAHGAITRHVGGKIRRNYRLRDWLVSRQRYWGAPIPMIYCDACGEVPVPEKDLPVLLPTDVDFRPTGESPLALSKKFHRVKCPSCGKSKGVRREVDTMDTFVCSSWYYLRYTDPQNSKEAFSKESAARWLPVHTYVGGAEHAVKHLLYARFIAKALRDAGFVDFHEPFARLRNQGLIMAEDGQKMSKSRGNVVNPDDVVLEYGADALRLFEMFLGPLEDAKPWSPQGILGVRRFLEKVYQWVTHWEAPKDAEKTHVTQAVHQAVQKVTNDIEHFRLNTAVSAMMILVNLFVKEKNVSKESVEMFLKILSPFAPHLAEELWEKIGHSKSIFEESWPVADPQWLKIQQIVMAIQVNGKLRATMEIAADASQDIVLAQAKALPKIVALLSGRTIQKEIVVPGKIINFVVKEI